MDKEKRFIAYDAYEKLADEYAARVDTKPHNAYLEKPTTLSLLSDVKGKHVLDAGCGPGSYTEWLVNNGAHVIAIDASPKMIKYAKERVGEKASFKIHDLREPLEFIQDKSLSLVLAPLCLDYIRNYVPVFKEFKRVLNETGVFVFSVGHPALNLLIETGIENYFKVTLFEMWWKGFGERVLVPSYHRPIEDITESLYKTGFLIERILESKPTLDYKKADSDGYEKVRKRPSFIHIRAIPNSKK
jgi:SAM-dependent methyltransferase